MLCLFVCLFVLTAAEKPLDPVPVCRAAQNWKDYDGQPVALLGRYTFRQDGPRKGRWMDQEACLVKLTADADAGPRLADQVAIDQPALDTRLTEIKKRTSLGKFRFGSADYDRWAVVYGRFRHSGEHDFELVYRGDGAVFFLADK